MDLDDDDVLFNLVESSDSDGDQAHSRSCCEEWESENDEVDYEDEPKGEPMAKADENLEAEEAEVGLEEEVNEDSVR